MKKTESEPRQAPAFRLLPVNRIEIGNVNWGYFQWSEYYIEGVARPESFSALFPLLKDSDFFRTSIAWAGWTDASKIKEIDDAWYGRYVFQSISESDYVPLKHDEFLYRLDFHIAGQKEYGLDYGRGFGTTVQQVYTEILPLIKQVTGPAIAYYELVVDEEKDKQKVSEISIGIWDYFKSFIGFDSTSNRVYRIEMGRD